VIEKKLRRLIEEKFEQKMRLLKEVDIDEENNLEKRKSRYLEVGKILFCKEHSMEKRLKTGA